MADDVFTYVLPDIVPDESSYKSEVKKYAHMMPEKHTAVFVKIDGFKTKI
jgi:hypothetical protein